MEDALTDLTHFKHRRILVGATKPGLDSEDTLVRVTDYLEKEVYLVLL